MSTCRDMRVQFRGDAADSMQSVGAGKKPGYRVHKGSGSASQKTPHAGGHVMSAVTQVFATRIAIRITGDAAGKVAKGIAEASDGSEAVCDLRRRPLVARLVAPAPCLGSVR